MDWQRTLFITAILALSFTLLIEWNAFQEKHTASIVEETTIADERATLPTLAATPASTGDIASPTAQASNDIPTASTPEQTVPSINTASKQSSSLIQVTTDVLEILIDPYGGDIVKVALPQHQQVLGATNKPYILLNKTASTTYVAQSGLIGTNGTDTAEGRPVFSSAQQQYTLSDSEDELVIDLQLQQGEALITKRFTFARGDHLIDVRYLVDNKSSEPWSASLFGQIKRDSHQPLAAGDSGLGVNPYLGAAITTSEENYKKLNFDDIREETTKTTLEGGWVAMVQHYFLSAWIPNGEQKNEYTLRKLNSQDIYLLSFTGPAVTIAPNSQGSLGAKFYVGPKDIDRLEAISEHLDLTIDFGWLWWIAKPLFHVLKWIHSFLGNWGWAIIVLTMLIKAGFFHLSATSYRSMANMRKIGPKMQELKERFGDDRQRLSQEMMKLYKTEKVNPMSGCLPIIVQMPVFISLYWVLMESVELRHAPFALWIADLSVKDPYFILPLLMGATMFIQQKLNPTPPDPMQAKIMQWMPVGFTVMFLWFPAGLVLYWVVNNSLSILQQYIITRNIEKAD